MIPYDQLCAALDRYVARQQGLAAPAEAPAEPASMAATMPLDDEPERTMISSAPVPRRTDDVSQEIDLGDVVDEEPV